MNFSRLDPMARTHVTPFEAVVNTAHDRDMRGPISIAFHLVRRGLRSELNQALVDEVCGVIPRPNIARLMGAGRNA